MKNFPTWATYYTFIIYEVRDGVKYFVSAANTKQALEFELSLHPHAKYEINFWM